MKYPSVFAPACSNCLRTLELSRLFESSLSSPGVGLAVSTKASLRVPPNSSVRNAANLSRSFIPLSNALLTFRSSWRFWSSVRNSTYSSNRVVAASCTGSTTIWWRNRSNSAKVSCTAATFSWRATSSTNFWRSWSVPTTALSLGICKSKTFRKSSRVSAM